MRRFVVVAALVGLALAISVTTAPSAKAGGTPLKLRQVATGLNRPVLVVSPPGDLERLFIVQQRGIISIKPCDQNSEPLLTFLNIDSLVRNQAFSQDERGLLGLAFDPDYQNNGFFFVHYNDNAGRTVLARYTVSADPYVADPSSAVILLTVSQPFSNHNGGSIAFSPIDGFLYLGLGDGGSGGDPSNRAQNGLNRLGKIHRYDVSSGALVIPPSNPFVGNPNFLDEIWAYGVRNPWRFSFDRQTGDLYIADVGQGSREEVNFQPASSTGGENYGWRLKEGELCFNPPNGCDPGGLTEPIHTYARGSGVSISGGYVYRGSRIPDLNGSYFFGDFGSDRVWTFRYNGTTLSAFENRTNELNSAVLTAGVSSFGQDGRGEVYVVNWGGGRIHKIESATTPDVTVTLSPVSTSVSPGDRLRFDVDVVNTTGASQQIEGWLEIYRTDGTAASQNPIQGPKTVMLSAAQTVGVTANLRIPNGAPSGRFIVKVVIGAFPNKIDATDCFSFTIAP